MTDVDESEAVAALQRLGLSKYEAQVFVALERLGTGSARDVDRTTDVPRSQVYGAAEDLEERGLVEVQQSNPIQYRAVDLAEAREILHDRFEREQDRAFDYLESAREAVEQGDERQEGVWTVHGRENVSARIQRIAAEADSRVVLATTGELFDDAVAATLRERADDVSVWVFSDSDAVADAFGDADGVDVSPLPDGAGEESGRLLAVDGDSILLSVVGDGAHAGDRTETAIWSSDTGFATVLLRLASSHLDENIGTKL